MIAVLAEQFVEASKEEIRGGYGGLIFMGMFFLGLIFAGMWWLNR